MNLYFLIVLGAIKTDGAEDFLPILSVWMARPQFTQAAPGLAEYHKEKKTKYRQPHHF